MITDLGQPNNAILKSFNSEKPSVDKSASQIERNLPLPRQTKTDDRCTHNGPVHQLIQFYSQPAAIRETKLDTVTLVEIPRTSGNLNISTRTATPADLLRNLAEINENNEPLETCISRTSQPLAKVEFQSLKKVTNSVTTVLYPHATTTWWGGREPRPDHPTT